MLLVLVVFLDVSFRSFPRIEQFNAAYKRQEETRLDHFSQRYLYMYYTDANIRAWMNTTITRIYGPDEQRRQFRSPKIWRKIIDKLSSAG